MKNVLRILWQDEAEKKIKRKKEVIQLIQSVPCVNKYTLLFMFQRFCRSL